MTLIRYAISIVTIMAACASPAAAADLSGRKEISLVTAAGEKIAIGHVDFERKNSGYAFKVARSDAPFGDYFLAMRPFKCIANAVQHVCHFPYRTSGEIRDDDLVDLEYALMFLHKKPQEVSVDPWNGVYYKMRIVDSGIEGIVHNVDMNLVLVAPFDTPERLIRAQDLNAADPGSHRFPRLVIE